MCFSADTFGKCTHCGTGDAMWHSKAKFKLQPQLNLTGSPDENSHSEEN